MAEERHGPRPRDARHRARAACGGAPHPAHAAGRTAARRAASQFFVFVCLGARAQCARVRSDNTLFRVLYIGFSSDRFRIESAAAVSRQAAGWFRFARIFFCMQTQPRPIPVLLVRTIRMTSHSRWQKKKKSVWVVFVSGSPVSSSSRVCVPPLTGWCGAAPPVLGGRVRVRGDAPQRDARAGRAARPRARSGAAAEGRARERRAEWTRAGRAPRWSPTR